MLQRLEVPDPLDTGEQPFSLSLSIPSTKALRSVPQCLLRVTVKIHLNSRGPAPLCV